MFCTRDRLTSVSPATESILTVTLVDLKMCFASYIQLFWAEIYYRMLLFIPFQAIFRNTSDFYCTIQSKYIYSLYMYFGLLCHIHI